MEEGGRRRRRRKEEEGERDKKDNVYHFLFPAHNMDILSAQTNIQTQHILQNNIRLSAFPPKRHTKEQGSVLFFSK